MDTTEDLWDRAHEHLALGEFERALELAADLERGDPEGGQEIRALALSATDRADLAAAGLERALALHPGSGRLWLLLGNLRSDLGELDLALAAYGRARACENVDLVSVGFHQAQLFETQGELARALVVLEDVPEALDFELATRVDCLRARLVSAMGMPARALDLVEERLDDCEGEELDLFLLAELLTERARALHASGRECEEVVEALLQAARLEPAYQPAADLLRTIEGRRSGASRLFQLVLEVRQPVLGEDPPRPGLDGHYRSYRVIAESPEEAARFALRFEQAACCEVVGSEEKAPLPGEPMGVAEASSAFQFSGS